MDERMSDFKQLIVGVGFIIIGALLIDLTSAIYIFIAGATFIIIGVLLAGIVFTKHISGALKIKADTSFMVLAIIMIALAIVYSNYSVTKYVGSMRKAALYKVGSPKAREALLAALLEECRYNREQIERIVQGKTGGVFNVSFDAYKANLYNATIDDAAMLVRLVRTYADVKGVRHVLLYGTKAPGVTGAGVSAAQLNEQLMNYRALEKQLKRYNKQQE